MCGDRCCRGELYDHGRHIRDQASGFFLCREVLDSL